MSNVILSTATGANTQQYTQPHAVRHLPARDALMRFKPGVVAGFFLVPKIPGRQWVSITP